MSKISEKLAVEKPVTGWLKLIGWEYKTNEDLQTYKRPLSNPILEQVLVSKIMEINSIGEEDAKKAYDILVQNLNNPSPIDGNERFLERLIEGTTLTINKEDKDIYYIDFENIWSNSFWVTRQYWVQGYKIVKTDIVCLVNGIPLIPIEAKTSAKKGTNWLEGVRQFSTYSIRAVKLFQTHLFGVACNGHLTKYGIPGSSAAYFFEWKDAAIDISAPNPIVDKPTDTIKFKEEDGQYFLDIPHYEQMKFGIVGLMQPARVLDILQNYIVFERTDDSGIVKKVARYQQLRAANKIVKRVVDEDLKTGIIWHTQGSGKSLTMLYTAYKLRNHDKLKDPTVYIVIDRKDLVDQLSGTFEDCDFPNTTKPTSISQLRAKIKDKPSEVIISTVQKFDSLGDEVDDRDNIIVLIDEAHRTQYGDFHSELMRVLPNARRFAFTGTPILKTTQTFRDYLDRYKIKEAIEDGATKPVHYTFGPQKWHLDKDKIKEGWDNITAELTEDQTNIVARQVQAWKVFLKHPDRIKALSEDIAKDFRESVEPNGFKAQIVACDKEACVLYYNELIKYFDPSEISIVFSQGNYDDEYRYNLYKDHYLAEGDLKKLIKKFKRRITEEEKRNGNNLKVFIVCNMLLTGFDAPIEQTMYLDSPLKDHNLLQAIARTNRPYEIKEIGIKKEFGRIVDYVGVFKNYNEALNYDPEDIGTFEEVDKLFENFPPAIESAMSFFSDIELEDSYECSRAIVQRLSTIDQNKFKQAVMDVVNLYEAISPYPDLLQYRDQYLWLLTIYEIYLEEFVRQSFDAEFYAAKTRKLIQENSKMLNFKRDLPEITIDENYLENLERLNLEPSDKAEKIIRDIETIIKLNENESPIYQEFQDRLENLINEKDNQAKEISDLLVDLSELFSEVNTASELPKKMGFDDKAAFDVFTLLKNKLTDADKELLKDFSKGLSDNIKKSIYSGWQNNDAELYRMKTAIKVFSQFDEYDSLPVSDNDELLDELLNIFVKNYAIN